MMFICCCCWCCRWSYARFKWNDLNQSVHDCVRPSHIVGSIGGSGWMWRAPSHIKNCSLHIQMSSWFGLNKYQAWYLTYKQQWKTADFHCRNDENQIDITIAYILGFTQFCLYAGVWPFLFEMPPFSTSLPNSPQVHTHMGEHMLTLTRLSCTLSMWQSNGIASE